MKREVIALTASCGLLLAASATAQHTITTYAGGGPEKVQAVSAALGSPVSVTGPDGSGNFFVAAQAAHRVFKVDPSGQITVLAGTGVPGFSGDGGPAESAALSGPSGVALDSAGNVFIVDWQNARLRRVDSASGVITTVVGTGVNGFAGDGGPASAALLNGPNGVTVDGAGNIFIADTGNQRIRKVDGGTGTISTVAGDGTFGFAGDGGAAIASRLALPAAVAVNAAGDVFIADTNNSRIRAIDHATGIITTLAGTGGFGFGGDGGLATAAVLYAPSGVAVDPSGDVLIADQVNRRVRRVFVSTGLIDTVAGNGGGSVMVFGGDGGPATSASLSYIKGLAVDGAGQIYVADTGFMRVRRVDTGGTIDTVAGNGWYMFGGDGEFATRATLSFPGGVAVDASGNVFVADTDNQRIRRVDKATGQITTVAGTGTSGFSGDGGAAAGAQLDDPYGMALDAGGNLYIADRDNNRIRRVSAAGIITTVAGNGALGFGGDGGAATGARLNRPAGVAVDGSGNLYIADLFNNRVRKVTAATGVITTIAGTGLAGFSGDGGPAIGAHLSDPAGVAVDAAGNVYIADRLNARIRKVSTSGTITTVAGDGVQAYTGDGGFATAASIVRPIAVAVDAAGQLFIIDTDGHNVRKVDAVGLISTLAGTGVGGFSGDGGPAASAQLQYPRGVAVDAGGSVFIVDTINQRVRRVANGAPVADAGADQTVTAGSSFTLDGSGSSDPDGDALSYTWRDAANAVIGTAQTLLQNLPAGTFAFTLTVSDGALSATDSVTVTVTSATPNHSLALTLISTENGGGSVTYIPSGGPCAIAPGAVPNTCVETYSSGTVVTLTAQPAPDAIFVGWGGDCTGTGLCTVALTQNATVTAEFLGPRLLAVNLISTENGGGSVQIVPSGLVCGVGPGFPPFPCNGSFQPGTPVQLTAFEAPDSVFVGWGGACSGTGTCIVSMTQHQVVTAEFLGPRLLAVNLMSTENGGGSVQIVPSGAVCGVGPGFPAFPCNGSFKPGTPVQLTAVEAPDSVFVGWGGACTGTGTCIVSMTQHQVVTAEFLGPRLLAVSLMSTENGGGSVQIVPSGVVCGVGPGFPPFPCNPSFKPGTPVQLTAFEAPDSVFVGWGGACTGTGTCIVSMTKHQVVTAEFLGPRLLAVNLMSTENGGGSVQIVPSGAVCGVGPGFPPFPCDGSFKPGTPVQLTALAAPDSVFLGWGGACTGTGTCIVSMTQHQVVTAEFLGPRLLGVTVNSVSGGSGSVGDGGALSCPVTAGAPPQSCTGSYTPGAPVMLTATPAPGSLFTGWGGACVGVLPTCTLTMSKHLLVSASFAPAPGATPPGSDVPVTPPDQNGATPATLTFEKVTQGGITSLTTSTPPPGGPAPPDGFGLGDPATYYELSTTALHAGVIRVCIDYTGVKYANELDLKLLHFEGGKWVDITTSLDAVNDIICGESTSLSPFVVAQAALPVAIDIEPGKFPNKINLRSDRNVKTAIFSTPSFDATQIDPATVTLAGASVRTKKKGRMAATVKDVDKDGRKDLVVQMEIEDLELDKSDTTAVLEGSTFDGRLVHGTDSVKVVR